MAVMASNGRNSAVMLYPRIESIIIEDRLREEYGDLEELAELIREHGVLEPILITTDRYLAAGERRLLAAKMAGLENIPAIDLGPLTPAQRRLVEVAENAGRKDFTPTELEKSKGVVALAEAVAAVIAEEAQSLPAPSPQANADEEGFVSDRKQNPKGGRPKKDAPLREVAQRIGMSASEISKARAHVATTDAFPVMQKPDWRQSHVLQAREALERLPEPEREAAVKVADQPRTHPQDVVMLLNSVANKPPEERGEIYRLNESADPRDRALAVTKAAGVNPMPDPRLALIDIILDKLRAATKPYPADPLTPRLRAVRDEVRAIKVEVEAVSFDARREMEGVGT